MTAVLIIWLVALALVVLIGVPAAILYLHRIWEAAGTIRIYAADTRAAAEGIARNAAPLAEPGPPQRLDGRDGAAR